jgi:hypothetical protein
MTGLTEELVQGLSIVVKNTRRVRLDKLIAASGCDRNKHKVRPRARARRALPELVPVRVGRDAATSAGMGG